VGCPSVGVGPGQDRIQHGVFGVIDGGQGEVHGRDRVTLAKSAPRSAACRSSLVCLSATVSCRCWKARRQRAHQQVHGEHGCRDENRNARPYQHQDAQDHGQQPGGQRPFIGPATALGLGIVKADIQELSATAFARA
jgi:hypothetical protein